MTIPAFCSADIENLLRETAERDILPHYRNLQENEVREKTPGDVVTVADMAAEHRLAQGLAKILPGSCIVGEEMTHSDAGVLKHFDGEAPVWVIDPLDGTGNFADGKPTFAVMVSLILRGVTCAGWIFDPLGDRMAVAQADAGCYLNDVRLKVKPAPKPENMHGGILSGFLPDVLRETAESSKASFSRITATMCAGHEYLALLSGDKHFVLYYRTLPWDHAAGVLLYHEAGGYGARLDGSLYRPTDGRSGLLVATDPGTWRVVHDLVVPSIAIIGTA